MIGGITFVVTLATAPNLQWGVFTGVGLTLLSFLYRRITPRVIEVGCHEDETLRDRGRFGLPPIADDVLAIRIDSALNFLTASTFERFITDRCRHDRTIKRVLFCAGSVNDIDASGVETLIGLQQTLRRDGIELYMCAVKKQVWDVMLRAKFIPAMGPQRIFATDRQAVAAMQGVVTI